MQSDRPHRRADTWFMAVATRDPSKLRVGTFTRAVPIGQAIDADARTVRFSFSSEQPVERFDYDKWMAFDEVLSHDPRHVNLERVRGGSVPLLWNHNRDEMIGKIIGVEIEGDRAYAVAKFSRNKRAEEIFQDVRDGIITEASFMYRVYEYENDSQRSKEEKPVYRGVNWEVFEISMVSIPADHTVGVGRSEDEGDRPNYVFVKGLETEGERMATNNDELRDLRSQLDSVSSKVSILERELEQRDQAIAQRDAQIELLQRQQVVGTKYESARRKAEKLLAEFKLTPAEFKETFADEPATDLHRLMSDGGTAELSNIEYYLGKVENRSPQRNVEVFSPLSSQPLPPAPGAPVVDEARAQALVNGALSSGKVIL